MNKKKNLFDPNEITCGDYRDKAYEMFNRDGEIEIDENAEVSISPDGGAYVAAWVWVGNEEFPDKKPCT